LFSIASFFQADERVKEVLRNGINKEQTREICLAALSVCTGDKQYLDEIEKMVTEGNTLDYKVAEYFRDHAGQSEEIDKLLKLNEEVYKKKQKQKSDDDDDDDD
jgi:poly-D-alanine transfer protein DltD